MKSYVQTLETTTLTARRPAADMLKALPLPLADAYLLEQFSGATLDQIDAMDFHRLARALETQRMRDVEGKRNCTSTAKRLMDCSRQRTGA